MPARALLVALALLAPLASQASRDTASGTAPAASAAVRLAIVIPRLLQLRATQQPRTLEVTAQDLVRGYVVARGLVDVLSTDRRGYQVQASLAAGPVVEAHIEGLERPVSVGGEIARVAMPSMVGGPRPQPYPVEYRLRLAPNSSPGTYAWPLALSIADP